LRAVLNDVSPIVARVFAIPDDVEITELHEVFLSMLGWQQDLGFIIREQLSTALPRQAGARFSAAAPREISL
jgi:hypothetical protein